MKCERCKLDAPMAKVCPNCGWKPGMSIGRQFAIGIGVVLVVLYVIGKAISSDPAVATAATPAESPAETPAIEVTAKELFAAYDANEVSADDTYKGHRLRVMGVVASVDKDFMDHVVIRLVGAGRYQTVAATMLPAEKSHAARLSKGQAVIVFCNGGGKVLTDPMIDDCSIL